MLLVSLLLCTTSFTSNFLNLTDIYIQIKGINPELYEMFFSSNMDELTPRSIDIDKKNNCLELSYYFDDNTTTDNITTYKTITDNTTTDNTTTDNTITDNTTTDNTTTYKTITDNTNYQIIYGLINKFVNKNKIEDRISFLKNSFFYKILKMVLIINIIVLCGFSLSLIVFSFSYKIMKESFDGNIEDYIAYEDKYDKDFYELDNHKLTEKEKDDLKNTYISDNTPNGKIIMLYDFETENFNYYYNNKNSITYYELEAVAKLYAIKNNARDLVIEREEDQEDKEDQEHKEDQEDKEDQEHKEDQEDQEDQEDKKCNKKQKTSVFAKIKKYNQKSDSNKKDQREKIENIKQQSTKINKIIDNQSKQTNTFKHIGKLIDFENILNETIDDTNVTQYVDKEQVDKEQVEAEISEIKKEPKNDKTNVQEVRVFDDSNMVIVDRPRAVSPPGKLVKKSSSKIMPKNNISFAEYKKQVLEPNRKK